MSTLLAYYKLYDISTHVPIRNEISQRSGSSGINPVYAGSCIDYEKIANELIRERFKGKSWAYTITKKDGAEESRTYTFEETEALFKLETGNVRVCKNYFLRQFYFQSPIKPS